MSSGTNLVATRSVLARQRGNESSVRNGSTLTDRAFAEIDAMTALLAKATVFEVTSNICVRRRVNEDGMVNWVVYSGVGIALDSSGRWVSEARLDTDLAATRFDTLDAALAAAEKAVISAYLHDGDDAP